MGTKHKTKHKAIFDVEKGLKTKTQITKYLDVSLNTLSTWHKEADDFNKAL